MLLDEVPLYQAWYRARLAWIFNDRVYPSLQRDPAWKPSDRSLNAINDGIDATYEVFETELSGRPDLIAKALPTYPPFGKRMLLDNGWYRSLKLSNVALVKDGIAEVRSDRIVATDGSEYPADVIVLATGFEA